MKESNYSWNEYKFRFEQKAIDFGHPLSKIEGLLLYAQKLFAANLPVIYDLRHLSYLTGYREEYMLRATSRPENFYRYFRIAKKNGHSREISEPLPGLKEIQYWLLDNVIKKLPPNKLNNAYLEGRSIISNAKFHTKQQKLLNIDIEKYFNNITKKQVEGFFSSLGYNLEVSSLIAGLLTMKDGLPQGSPSSPYLSSIMTVQIDVTLLAECRALGLRYSRYADDISISGEFNTEEVVKKVNAVLLANGFKANSRKTTVKKSHQRQMVTGVVVNKKLSVKKKVIKELRQELYYIHKYGLEQHLRRKEIQRRNYLNVLEGKLNYFCSVKRNNAELSYIRRMLSEIKIRESAEQLRSAFE
ncbi:reverse transcriptase family protein [Pedobacter paludis]|uniref:RNA-directed DNA polymerase n=1 Tax=Pedobacter paludis TaxID=2203212 RepID=A0A317F747_9SPHI|nr:reverse transcriptase family protein [Pedobacter paludis]PWS33348.1 reverse transcriptase [Pedobacter paludis]